MYPVECNDMYKCLYNSLMQLKVTGRCVRICSKHTALIHCVPFLLYWSMSCSISQAGVDKLDYIHHLVTLQWKLRDKIITTLAFPLITTNCRPEENLLLCMQCDVIPWEDLLL